MTQNTMTARPDTDQEVRTALAMGGVIDITTTGRRTGEPRRLEIVFFNFGGRVYISGMPGRRSWYANLAADPKLIFHLKRGLEADLPARARLITDDTERRALLALITRRWRREDRLELFVKASPLIEVEFEDRSLLGG